MKYLGPPQSGSLANLTYSRSRGGQYVRARAGRGGAGDADFATIVNAWQTLTDDERRLWSEFADRFPRKKHGLGQTITLTGFSMFVAQNRVIFANVAAVVQTVPAELSPGQLWGTPLLDSVVWVGGGNEIEVTVSFPFGTLGVFGLVSSGVVTPGTMAPPGRGKWWKHFYRADWGSLTTTPTTVATAGIWSSVFGAPSSGDWLFVGIRPLGIDQCYAGPIQWRKIQVP